MQYKEVEDNIKSRHIRKVLLDNKEMLIEKIDDLFIQEEDHIQIFLSILLKEKLQLANYAHYDLDFTGCIWDHSGEIYKEGMINLEDTVFYVLNEELTGNKEPSFSSKYGWNWLNYSDSLCEDVSELANDIMLTAIRNYFKEIDEEFINFSEDGNDNDDILEELYDKSMTTNYFSGIYAFYDKNLEMPIKEFLKFSDPYYEAYKFQKNKGLSPFETFKNLFI